MNVEEIGSGNIMEMKDKEKKDKRKEDEEEERLPEYFTYKDIGSDYFQVLVNKGRPSLCKIIWWLISAVLFVFCAYMVYKLLVGYFQYNSYDKVQVKWVNNVTLPAITICSPNVLNYTMIKENFDSTQLKDLELLINEIEVLAGDAKYKLSDDKVAELQSKYSWLDKMEYGSGVVDLFEYYKMDPFYFTTYMSFDYKFGGKEVYMTEAEYNAFSVPHELGTCLNLNSNQKLVQTVAGSKWGLTIDLNANIADYLFSTASAGFKIFLHNANETLLLQDSGYLIQPGMETFIKLNKKKVTRLEKPYGECVNTASIFQPSHMRTTRECNEDLKLQLLVDGCKCVPWYLTSRIENVRTVYDVWSDNPDYDEYSPVTAAQNATYDRLREYWVTQVFDDDWVYDADYDAKCSFLWQQICNVYVQEQLTNINTNINGSGTVKCKESCKYDDYDVEITSSIFPPTESYFKTMIQPRASDPSYTFDNARENFVRLHVFYDELTESIVKQEKAYEVQNFIAEFGGTVDLLIGISFFTLFQIGEIAVAYFLLKCWKKGKKEDEVQDCV